MTWRKLREAKSWQDAGQANGIEAQDHLNNMGRRRYHRGALPPRPARQRST